MSEEQESLPLKSLTPPEDEVPPKVNSLRELIDRVTGRNLDITQVQEDAGIADAVPFPFLAIVTRISCVSSNSLATN